jgi:hypothetical protein
MQKTKKSISFDDSRKRQLSLNVTMFMLNNTGLKDTVWTLKNADYDQIKQVVKVRVESTFGAKGTKINSLKVLAKPLSDYLFEQGITLRRSKVQFYIKRKEESTQSIYKLLESII